MTDTEREIIKWERNADFKELFYKSREEIEEIKQKYYEALDEKKKLDKKKDKVISVIIAVLGWVIILFIIGGLSNIRFTKEGREQLRMMNRIHQLMKEEKKISGEMDYSIYLSSEHFGKKETVDMVMSSLSSNCDLELETYIEKNYRYLFE